MARPSPPASGEKRKRVRGALPTANDLLSFIRESPSAVGKREIARAFNLAPADRPALRDMLRQIERSGAATRAANRRLTGAPPLPEVLVVERIGTNEDGVPLARPVAWPASDPAPVVRLAEEGG